MTIGLGYKKGPVEINEPFKLLEPSLEEGRMRLLHVK
jgi:hypothetical protein